MKLARQVPRYRCDFCTKVSTKPAMVRHEPTCFKNPNRFCRKCDNTSKHMEWEDRGDYQVEVEVDCIYCLKYKEYTDFLTTLT